MNTELIKEKVGKTEITEKLRAMAREQMKVFMNNKSGTKKLSDK